MNARKKLEAVAAPAPLSRRARILAEDIRIIGWSLQGNEDVPEGVRWIFCDAMQRVADRCSELEEETGRIETKDGAGRVVLDDTAATIAHSLAWEWQCTPAEAARRVLAPRAAEKG